MTLFEIGDDIRALDSLLEESGGELTPEIEAAWLAMAGELQHNEGAKLDGYVHWIRRLEMESTAARAEAEQYMQHATARENRVKWAKDRLKDYLILTGRKKVETATGRVIAIQANGGHMPLVWNDQIDPELIPDEFAVVRRTPDTDAIRKHLAAGGTLPFVVLGERASHLRIR